MDQQKTVKRKTRFPATKMGAMMKAMRCMECDFIPSPDRRYLCSRGHLLCAACGAERQLKHGGKCMIELPLKEVEASLDPADKKVVPVNGKLKLVSPGPRFAVCQYTVELCGPDPFFTAFWMHTVWKCPVVKNKVERCQAVRKGSQIYTHLELCLQGKGEEDEEKAEGQEEVKKGETQ